MGAVPTAFAFTRNVSSPRCHRRRTRLYQRIRHILISAILVEFRNTRMDDQCMRLQVNRSCTARMDNLLGLYCRKHKMQIIHHPLKAMVQVRTLDRCMTIVALHSPVIPKIK